MFFLLHRNSYSPKLWKNYLTNQTLTRLLQQVLRFGACIYTVQYVELRGIALCRVEANG